MMPFTPGLAARQREYDAMLPPELTAEEEAEAEREKFKDALDYVDTSPAFPYHGELREVFPGATPAQHARLMDIVAKRVAEEGGAHAC